MSPNSDLGKILRRSQRVQNLVLCILAFIAGASLYLGIHSEGRVSKSEDTTCEIQGRGLKATPFLIGFVRGVDEVLTTIPRQQRARLPKPAFNKLFNLEYNGQHYVYIEHKQPHGRVC